MQTIFRNIKSLLFFPLLIIPVGISMYGLGTFLQSPTLVGTEIFTTSWSYIPQVLKGVGATIQSQSGLLAAVTIAWGLSRKSITVILTTMFCYFAMQAAFESTLPIILTKEIYQELANLPYIIYPFNIFGGIVLAIVVTLFNESKYVEDIKKSKISLQGQFFQALAGILAGLIAALVLAILWGNLISLTRAFVQFLSSGAIGSFVYGFVSVVLRPIGVTDLYETFERFTSIGGAWNIPAPVNRYVYGTESVWLSQLLYNHANFTSGTISSVQYIYSIFVIPAIGFAVINSSFVEHRKVVRTILSVFMVISLVVGYTLPVEIILLLTAPMLFILAAGSYGLLSLIVYLLSRVMEIHLIPISGGGVLDLIFFGIIPGAEKTGAWVLILIGAISSFVTYFLYLILIKQFKMKVFGRNKEELALFNAVVKAQQETNGASSSDKVDILIDALGGYDNIEEVIVSMYRLHVKVKNTELIEELAIKQNGAAGIFVVSNTAQIILGALTHEYYNLMLEKIDGYR